MMWLGLMGAVAMGSQNGADAWPVGKNIQRTMRLLATSTAEHRNRVKVLFYGQSITKQDWWKTVAVDLKRRFPYADLTCENRAIGGFAANLLKKAVQHDVFASYPDLIILHDYGGEPDYEELIRRIRANVASEVLVQSDHYVNAPPKAEAWHDQHVTWLCDLAARDELGFVDVRTPWKQHLADRKLAPDALLADGVHLNAAGCDLMASLIEGALVYDPKLPASKDLVKDLAVRWTNGRATVRFDGNRIDLNLLAASSQQIDVRIDGRRPSEIPELYCVTRPGDCFAVDVPAVFKVDRNEPLLLEDWTLTLTDISPDVSHWRFTVHGSQTGDDGEGSSDQPFVSRSGRAVIDHGSWYVHEAFQISKQRPPEGFAIRWSVRPEFRDEVQAGASGAVTVAQGLSNGEHTLELTASGSISGLRNVTVYRPPGRP